MAVWNSSCFRSSSYPATTIWHLLLPSTGTGIGLAAVPIEAGVLFDDAQVREFPLQNLVRAERPNDQAHLPAAVE